MSQLTGSQAEGIVSDSACFFLCISSMYWMRQTHIDIGGLGAVLLSLPAQMLMSSRNAFTDMP